MERLRWWLLLLTAVMFSMSGCATQDWSTWSTNRDRLASAQVTSRPTTASVSEDTIGPPMREEWWGRLAPEGDDEPYVLGEPDGPPAALPAMD